MIETKEELCEWKKRADSQGFGAVTLDLEADSMHRYQEKLCLIQYADKDGGLLIDPLAIEDMSPFTTWLGEQRVWMHGADYDRILFKRAFNILPHEIWDTQIAARLLGFRKFGLASLVEQFFGVTLPKSAQKSDWAKRPLSEKMIQYALNDVHYMLEMGENLIDRLTTAGRLDWFEESCREAHRKFLAKPDTSQEDSWRIQGSGKLRPRGLAALKELWQWRDHEARLWDKPAFMVCNNNDLIQWCITLENGKPISIPPRYQKARRGRLTHALERLMLLTPDQFPQKVKRERKVYDQLFEQKVSALMEKRDQSAQKLDIDPSIIAPRGIIEEIAYDEALGVPQLMSWQKNLLGF